MKQTLVSSVAATVASGRCDSRCTSRAISAAWPFALAVLLAGACAHENDEVDDPAYDDIVSGGGKADGGADGHVDLYRTDENVIAVSRSVAAVLDKEQLYSSIPGETALLPFSFAEDTLAQVMNRQGHPLCESEPFSKQPVRARGTAFLIASNMVVTAGHVATRKSCEDMRFVFDYAYHVDPATRPTGLREITTRPTENIYSCRQVILDPNGHDIALVLLDRPVTGRYSFPLVSSQVLPPVGEPVAMLGHPSGLPMKFAAPGRVIHRDDPFGASTEDRDAGFFTNVGADRGGAGSPVMSRRGVEGVLVGDGNDWAWNEAQGCYETKVCQGDGSNCAGEYVVHARHVIDMLRSLE